MNDGVLEVMGGLLLMGGILALAGLVLWLVTPLLLLAVKGKVERTLLLVEELERRLESIERRLPPGPGGTPLA